jgi:hypothetical protein
LSEPDSTEWFIALAVASININSEKTPFVTNVNAGVANGDPTRGFVLLQGVVVPVAFVFYEAH